MKKILLFAVMAMAFTSADMPEPKQDATEYVYICTGPKSKRYHRTPNCSGLRSCSGKIVKITVHEAEQKHRTPCKRCY